MKVLGSFVLCLVTIGCAFADRVVYSSGSPAFVLDTAASTDPANPAVRRLTYSSGRTNSTNTERWTATPFHIAYTDTVNALEIPYAVGSTAPSNYGFRIYKADGALGGPGTQVTSGSGSMSTLAPVRYVYPNGYQVDNFVRVTFPAAVLTPGDYWFTFYGTGGEIILYGGAPGGLGRNHLWRRTTPASSWQQYSLATNDTRMPNYGQAGLFDATYPVAGPNPNDLYQIAFRLLNVGGTGTLITGQVQGDVTTLPVPALLSDGTPQVYELRLLDAGGSDAMVFSFATVADGTFSVGPVLAGTYTITLRAGCAYVGRYGLYNPDGSVISQQTTYQGLGVPWLGMTWPSAAVSGASFGLGFVGLSSGDTNLDGVIDVFDLNNVLVVFGADATVAPMPPGFLSLFDLNGDRRVDVFDFNAVLSNFGKSGPHR